MDNQPMEGNFHDIHPEHNADLEGAADQILDPLKISIEDTELVRIVDERIANYDEYYEEHYDLAERRKNNEMYYFGRQILEKEREKLLKTYESRFQDNVLYEIGTTLKALAMSRVPDLIVLPGNDSEDAMLMAQEISKAVDTEVKERENRKVLGITFEHRPVYLTGIMKCVWNNERDDYEFVNIHPDLVAFDHTCTTNNADDMSFVSQIIEATVEQVLLRFPDKHEEFIRELARDGIKVMDGKPTWKQLATTIKYREVWFTEYKKHSETEVERIDGVLWKYRDCILKKMKDPNFDHEGETEYFAMDDTAPQGKRPVNPQEMQYMALTGIQPPHVGSEKKYNNYFRKPRKPFFFMGYDQWGKQPLDETSWLEQNLYQQKNLDKRGKQIDETLDNRGHHIYSKESGLKSADIEGLDMNDPDQDVVVDGNVNDVHKYLEPARPTPQEFENLTDTRNRMQAAAGANAVNGEVKSNTPATSSQIGRESNFTRADDMVEDTINAAAEWMAEWALQFIKLRYTEEHLRWILGDAGEPVYLKLHQNMVSDGMIVKIKASGTDKLRAQNNAMDMAKMEMIDPFNFARDMGLSDPEGRTEDLILFKTDMAGYMAKVIHGLQTPEQMAQALESAPPSNSPPQVPGQQMPGQGMNMPQSNVPQPMPMPQQGGQPGAQPSPQNTAALPTNPMSGGGAPNGSVRNL